MGLVIFLFIPTYHIVTFIFVHSLRLITFLSPSFNFSPCPQYGILNDDNDDSGAENVSAKQYTIMVRNLPKDTTLVELVEHFSTLYPLDQVPKSYHSVPFCAILVMPFS